MSESTGQVEIAAGHELKHKAATSDSKSGDVVVVILVQQVKRGLGQLSCRSAKPFAAYELISISTVSCV